MLCYLGTIRFCRFLPFGDSALQFCLCRSTVELLYESFKNAVTLKVYGLDPELTMTTRFLSGAAVAASLAANRSAADITSELISSQPVRGVEKER